MGTRLVFERCPAAVAKKHRWCESYFLVDSLSLTLFGLKPDQYQETGLVRVKFQEWPMEIKARPVAKFSEGGMSLLVRTPAWTTLAGAACHEPPEQKVNNLVLLLFQTRAALC